MPSLLRMPTQRWLCGTPAASPGTATNWLRRCRQRRCASLRLLGVQAWGALSADDVLLRASLSAKWANQVNLRPPRSSQASANASPSEALGPDCETCVSLPSPARFRLAAGCH